MVWILGLVAAYALWRAGLAWGLFRLDRRAAARGWPADFTALNAYYQLPAGEENAAPEILAAVKALDALDRSARWDRVPRPDPLDGCFEKMETLLARHAAREMEEEDFQREQQALSAEMNAHMEQGRAQLDAIVKDCDAVSAALAANDTEAFSRLVEGMEFPVDYLKDPIPDKSTVLPEEWRVGIHRELSRYAPVMPHFERAAAIGATRFPVDFERWPDCNSELLDAQQSLKTGAHLFERIAVMHADAGRTDEAVAALEKLFRLAQMVEPQPTVMSQLVWMRLIGIGLDGIAFVLGRCALGNNHLQVLENCLDRASRHDPYAVAWAGERCIVRPSFDVRDARPETFERAMWEGFSKTDPPEDDSLDEELALGPLEFPGRSGAGHWRLIYEIPYKFAGLESLDCLLFLRAVDAGLAEARQSPAHKAVRWRENYEKIRRGSPPFLLNSRSFLALPMHTLMAVSVIDTHIASARTALAIERFRVERGALPESLSELPGETPIDIYSGALLQYRRLNNGYVVYSVGPDGKDGGGEPGAWQQGGDTTFRVTWPG